MKKIILLTTILSLCLFAVTLNRYSTSGGIVTDSDKLLQWQDNNNSSAATWSDAMDYCEALTLDSGKWRLPNAHELESIVEMSSSEPAMNSIFQTHQTNEAGVQTYWTSTTFFGSSADGEPVGDSNESAWTLDFKHGTEIPKDKGTDTAASGNTKNNNDAGDEVYTRCVRDLI